MSEHQKETAFLRRLLSYQDTAERRELDERITTLERDERCVRRAVWVMGLCAALAAAGLCYAVVFLLDPRMNGAQFMAQTVIKVFSAVALGSLGCALAFRLLVVLYRRNLDQQREQCRRLAMDFIDSRFGNQPSPRKHGSSQVALAGDSSRVDGNPINAISTANTGTATATVTA